MSQSDCPCENPLSILGLKTKPTKKEIKKIWRKLQKYHPDSCPITIDEEFNRECREKYNDLTAFVNRARDEYDDMGSVSSRDVNRCVDCYKKQIKKYSQEELRYALFENELDVNGSKKTLEGRIIDNIPYMVFKLNVWQYNAQKNLIDKYLKKSKENKLTYILTKNNLPANGNKSSLIKTIKENIDESELFRIIEDVEKDFRTFSTQLKKLSKKQLIAILKKNNLSTKGKEPLLIERILDNLTAENIKNSLENISLIKEESLKKLEQLIGRSKFSQNYLNMLASYGLEKSHGLKIKEEITLSIYDYEISEDEVEKALISLLNKTSKEYEKELLNELYAITGKDKHSKNYQHQLDVLQLSESEGEEVKNDIIALIMNHKIRKGEIESKLLVALEEKYRKFEEEKLEILHNYTGSDELTFEFKEFLAENELNDEEGFRFKKEMEDLIHTTKIPNDDIIPEFKKLIVVKKYDLYLEDLNIYELNQIAIINGLEKFDTVEKQTDLFINSDAISISTLKSNITDIKQIKENLRKLSKRQLKYILTNLNLSASGVKRDLIYTLFSNVHYTKINDELIQINNIFGKLNDLSAPQLEEILIKHSIQVTGSSEKKISEIAKRVDASEIKKDLESLKDLNSQLEDIDAASLNYICDVHGIEKSKSHDEIIKEIIETVDLIEVKSDMLKVKSIEEILKTFNRKQLEYLTKSDSTDIDTILENINLKEVEKFNKVIKRITKKLNSYDFNQLNYILKKYNLPQQHDKEDLIDMILQHVSVPDIQKNIRELKHINNKINSLSDEQAREILEKNGIEYNDGENNISKIKQLPIHKVEKYLKSD